MNIGVICHNHNSVFMASVSDLSVVVVVPATYYRPRAFQPLQALSHKS